MIKMSSITTSSHNANFDGDEGNIMMLTHEDLIEFWKVIWNHKQYRVENNKDVSKIKLCKNEDEVKK
jgi:hypothetical protein